VIGLFLVRKYGPPDEPKAVEPKPIAPRPVAAKPVASSSAMATPAPVATSRRFRRSRPVDPLAKTNTGRLDRLRDLVDASIGMYLVRQLLGRPTTRRSKEPPIPLTYLDEDVVASRIGAVTTRGPVVSRPTKLVVAGSPVVASLATDPIAPAPPPRASRGRLYRDTVLALGGFAVLIVLVANVLPLVGPSSGIAGVTGTPESSAAIVIVATPSPTAIAIVPTPSPTPTESPTPIPSPSTAPSPRPSPTPVPTATVAPAQHTPTPTAVPIATPTPTPKPTPKATKTPTPSASPPIASFSWQSPNGLSVTFLASTSGPVSTYSWSFDDGTVITVSDPSVTHVFSGPGIYQVTLVAHGPTGDSALVGRSVTLP